MSKTSLLANRISLRYKESVSQIRRGMFKKKAYAARRDFARAADWSARQTSLVRSAVIFTLIVVHLRGAASLNRSMREARQMGNNNGK